MMATRSAFGEHAAHDPGQFARRGGREADVREHGLNNVLEKIVERRFIRELQREQEIVSGHRGILQ